MENANLYICARCGCWTVVSNGEPPVLWGRDRNGYWFCSACQPAISCPCPTQVDPLDRGTWPAVECGA